MYRQAADTFDASLQRLARAYEADPEAVRDLLQDIHLQLWSSFAHFDQRCSLRTWVYRVADNVAIRHVVRQRRIRKTLASIEEIESMPSGEQGELAAGTIAEITGFSAANVAMKVHRIKNILKRWFHEGGSHAG